MNREYLSYIIRSKKHLSIFLAIIGLLPTFIYLMNFDFYGPLNVYLFKAIILIFAGIVFVEAFILPFVYLHFINSKRALDTYYNIPISRSSINITNVVHIYSQIVIFNLIGIIFPILHNLSVIDKSDTLLSIVIALVFAFVIILMVIAIMYKTHSTIDALLITAAYVILPFLIYGVLDLFNAYYVFGLSNIFTKYLEYMNIFSVYLNPISCALDMMTKIFDEKIIIPCLEMTIAGIWSFLSIRSDIKKRKAEVSETPSNNFFAYPLIIGLVTVCLLLVVNFSKMESYTMLIFVVVIFIAYLIMTFVYRRKIKIVKKDLLLFCVSLAVSLVIVNITSATDAFGINKLYKQVNSLYQPYYFVSIEQTSSDADDTYTSYVLYINDSQTITDADTIDRLIAFEDMLYERFKYDEHYNDYNYDSSVHYVYFNLEYMDENGWSYFFSDGFSLFNLEQLDEVIALLNIFDEENLEIYKSSHNYNDDSNRQEIITRSELISELTESVN